MSAGTRRGGVLLASVFALASSACVAEVRPFVAPSQAEWTEARGRLAVLRASAPRDAYVEQVSIAFREPGTGKIFEGRGALAVLPRKAMRMILVGPGGTTALDVWVTPDAWRFSVPPIHLVKRGGREAEATLPIGFFRWWFLAPYDGRLRTILGRSFVLDDGAGVVTLEERLDAAGRSVAARRKNGAVVEHLDFRGRADGKAAQGDHATYRNEATGLRVEVDVDAVGTDPPEPETFVDPDAAGGAP